jgi:DNA modification methylase
VLHGDCVTVLGSLPAGSVDFVLTDALLNQNLDNRLGA